jgi:hypothetical protein
VIAMKIHPLIVGVMLLSAVMSACGGTSPAGQNEIPATADISNQPQIEETAGEPFITGPGLEPVKLLTRVDGAGEKPLFAWEAVLGAGYYQLVVFDEAGKPYWAWEGSGTQIHLGGTQEQPPAGSSGPVIESGYSWAVIAYDAEGNVLASSEVRPISP